MYEYEHLYAGSSNILQSTLIASALHKDIWQLLLSQPSLPPFLPVLVGCLALEASWKVAGGAAATASDSGLGVSLLWLALLTA